MGNSHRFMIHTFIIACMLGAMLTAHAPAFAQSLERSIEIDRVLPKFKQPTPAPSAPQAVRSDIPPTPAPTVATGITLTLRAVNITGATAVKDSDISTITAPYINREITLDIVWLIAEQITKLYQDRGYFLSRAFVPEQEIENGIITIGVVEGYIGAISGDTDLSFITPLAEALQRQKPVTNADVEAFLLSLNNMPGYTYAATLKPLANAPTGAVALHLTQSAKAGGVAQVAMNNHGSRFLGPYQVEASLQNSFLPRHMTGLNVVTSAQVRELKYASFNHFYALDPRWKIGVFGSHAVARPGAALRTNDIRSQSTELGTSISYQWVQQRMEQLVSRFTIDGLNSSVNVLSTTPLVRDKIRAARFETTYETTDFIGGRSTTTVGLTQGLSLLGATKKGSANPSRPGAAPDFKKMNIDYSRAQNVTDDLVAVLNLSGQMASRSLHSAEEFGYGGQNFGRAFNPSEIAGDHGINAAIELRYLGLLDAKSAGVVPYAFIDAGKVWNKDAGADDFQAASVGGGARWQSEGGTFANLGAALPMGRTPEHSLYGTGRSARISLRIGQEISF